MKNSNLLITAKNFLVVVFLLSFYGVFTANAQEVISSGGGSGISSTHQLDWTIGEPVIETFVSGTNTLTQGFQQSNLIVTEIDQLTIVGIKLKVYPNPVSDFLIIENKSDNMTNFRLRLFDVTGKLLLEKDADQNIENLNMQPYRSGSYLLRIYSANETPLQTIKVVKN
jgi:hypothetical protein